jgi:hypothetical protein
VVSRPDCLRVDSRFPTVLVLIPGSLTVLVLVDSHFPDCLSIDSRFPDCLRVDSRFDSRPGTLLS